MWLNMVVILSPWIYFVTCLVHCFKPILVQALISEFAVKACQKGILCQFAGLYKTKLNTYLLASEKHCLAGEFCSVVANHPCWLASFVNKLTKKACNLTNTDRDRYSLPDHIARAIVYHVHNSETSAVTQSI